MGQSSEVNTTTHQDADKEGPHYNVLAPGLRDNDDSHNMLNHDHNYHQLHKQEFLRAV